MEIIYRLEQIEAAAIKFLKAVKEYRIIAFHGNLGTGKTSFIRAICVHLQVTDKVTSPTFSIIHLYHTRQKKEIYHLDLYRLKNKAEAMDAGVEECFYSGNMCFIEWPDKISGILPLETIHVFIEITGEFSRKLAIKFP